MNRAVFLDRDGTINVPRKRYVTDPSQFKFLEGAAEAIARLSESDYKIIVATNQSAVGRGVISLEVLEEIHELMLSQVEAAGGRLDAVLVCTHRPDEGCGCRKPETGLVDLAVSSFDLDVSASWFVGDNTKDIVCGKAAGLKTVLVGTGYGGEDGLYDVKADYGVSDLKAAVDLILGF